MITKDIKARIKQDEVKLNTKLYAYEGDQGIVFEITLQDWKYFFSQRIGVEEDQLVDCNARILLFGPNKEKLKIDNVPIQDNEIKFKVSKALTSVVGEYKVYIQITKPEGETVTCPPFPFEVKPLGDFSKVPPLNQNIIKVDEQNFLIYDTNGSVGIKSVGELPKTTTFTPDDYVIIEQDNLTNIIKVSELLNPVEASSKQYADEKDTALKSYVDTEISAIKEIDSTILNESKAYTNTEIGKNKEYIDTKTQEGKTYIDNKIKDLVGTAPETLDTIYEIAEAVNKNGDVVNGLLESKANKEHTHNATDIVESLDKKFVSEAEKTGWNSKYDDFEIVDEEIIFKSNGVEVKRANLPHGFTGNYNDLINIPTEFNPKAHVHEISDINGLPKVENDFISNSTENAISVSKAKETKDALDALVLDHNNTKDLLNTKYDSAEIDKGNNLLLKVGNEIKQRIPLPQGFDGKYTSLSNIPTEFNPSAHTHTKDEVEGIPNVIDDFNSTSPTDALSANKGKELKEAINAINSQSTHGHTNLDELEKIQIGDVDKWNNKAEAIHTHSIKDITDMPEIAKVIVEDSLTSTSKDNALSANQGKILNEKISGIHTHSNMDVLNGISGADISNWNDKAKINDNAETLTETWSGQKISESLKNATPADYETFKSTTTKDIGDLKINTHNHINKDVLDSLSQDNLNSWNGKAKVDDKVSNITDTWSSSKISQEIQKSSPEGYATFKKATETQLSNLNKDKHNHTNIEVLNGIDTIKIGEWDNKETITGSQEKATRAETNAKGYTDTKISELVGTAPEAMNTIQEISEALKGDANIVDTLTTQIGGKADKVHTHTKSEITDLFDVIDNVISTSKIDALSANQGKLLNDRLILVEDDKHSHTNLEILEGITSVKIGEWNSKADGTHSHSISDIIDMPTIPSVEDVLTSSSSTNALSANQGKELDTRLKIVENSKHNHTNIGALNNLSFEKMSEWSAKAKINDNLINSNEAWSGFKISEELDAKANITHTHNAIDIIEDSTHKFITDVEKDKIKNSVVIDNTLVSNTKTWTSDKINEEIGKATPVGYDTFKSTTESDISNLKSSSHSHSNIKDLDVITSDKIKEWDDKTSINDIVSTNATTWSSMKISREIENSVPKDYDTFKTTTESDISALQKDTHTHTNITELNSITSEKIKDWNGKADIADYATVNGMTWSSYKISREIANAPAKEPADYAQLKQDVENLKAELTGIKANMIANANGIIEGTGVIHYD